MADENKAKSDEPTKATKTKAKDEAKSDEPTKATKTKAKDEAKSDEPTKATKTKAKDEAKSDEPKPETVKLEPVATGPAVMEVHTPGGGRLLCKRGEGVVLELTPAQQAQYRAAGLDVTPSKSKRTETAADRIRQRLATR